MNTPMKGTIHQIIGPVVDVKFEGGIPNIEHALVVEREGGDLVLEVQQHAGGGVVRAIAMSSTDGLSRGMTVHDTGKPISVPVGKETLGRMFNVIGAPIDGMPPVKTKTLSPIYRATP